MVTSPHAGVKRVWNVITADNRSFCGQVQLFSVLVILLSVFFKACTGAGPVDALEVQSSNSNTKVSRVQVHSLSEGPTRVLGVHLTFQSMHFDPQTINTIARFHSAQTDCHILL